MTQEFIPANNTILLPNNSAPVNDVSGRRLNMMVELGDSYIDPRTDPRMNIQPAIMGPRHRPTTHAQAYETIHQAFGICGLDIVSEVCAMDGKGENFFGIVELGTKYSDYSPIMAYRWSTGQKLARVLAGGSNVWICTNLCIGGKIAVRKKQTTNMQAGLIDAYIDGIYEVLDFNLMQDEMLNSFRTARITKETAYAAITKMMIDGIITQNHFKTVVDQWHEPMYDDHAQYGDSVWKLWNAVTQAYKPKEGKTIEGTLCERSPKLLNLMQYIANNKAK